MKQCQRQRKMEAKQEREQQQHEALNEEKFWASSHLRALRDQLKSRDYTNPTTPTDGDRAEYKHKARIWKAFKVRRRKRPPKKLQTKIINKANSMTHIPPQPPSLEG